MFSLCVQLLTSISFVCVFVDVVAYVQIVFRDWKCQKVMVIVTFPTNFCTCICYIYTSLLKKFGVDHSTCC